MRCAARRGLWIYSFVLAHFQFQILSFRFELIRRAARQDLQFFVSEFSASDLLISI